MSGEIKSLPSAVYESLKSQYQIPSVVRITSKEDILQVKQVTDLSKKDQEHFITISLNTACDIIKVRTTTIGLLNHSLVHPREVFRNAIKDNAHSIICVHNHPTGSLIPSDPDIKITTQLKNAGEILGIQVLDHIIISKNGISSMRETGYI